MVSKADAQGSRLDTAKLTFAVLFLLVGVVGFYSFEEQSLLLRVLGLIAVAGASVAIAITTGTGKAAWGFARDSRTELRKVVWPTRQETIQTTLVVMLVVILIGVFLWLLDSLLMWVVKLLTGQGG